MTPHRSTTPFRTTISIDPRAPQGCFSISASRRSADRLIRRARGTDLGGQRGEGAQQIRAADDPHHAAVTEHRHTLDPLALHELHDRGERRILGDAGHVGGRGILHLASMRVDVLAGEPPRPDEHLDPPWTLALCSRFGTPQKITLGNDPSEMVLGVDHR
jgi:hypothetical protein